LNAQSDLRENSLAPFVFRKAALQVSVFVASIPGAAIPCNETKGFKLPFGKSEAEERERKGIVGNVIFHWKDCCRQPSHNFDVVATQLTISRRFVCKLSSSPPRKVAVYAKREIVRHSRFILFRHPPNPRWGLLLTAAGRASFCLAAIVGLSPSAFGNPAPPFGGGAPGGQLPRFPCIARIFCRAVFNSTLFSP